MQARKEITRLSLTRKKDEAIRIRDDIRLMVVGIRGNKVRIGIQAPKDVDVDREEVHLAKKAANNSTKKTA